MKHIGFISVFFFLLSCEKDFVQTDEINIDFTKEDILLSTEPLGGAYPITEFEDGEVLLATRYKDGVEIFEYAKVHFSNLSLSRFNVANTSISKGTKKYYLTTHNFIFDQHHNRISEFELPPDYDKTYTSSFPYVDIFATRTPTAYWFWEGGVTKSISLPVSEQTVNNGIYCNEEGIYIISKNYNEYYLKKYDPDLKLVKQISLDEMNTFIPNNHSNKILLGQVSFNSSVLSNRCGLYNSNLTLVKEIELPFYYSDNDNKEIVVTSRDEVIIKHTDVSPNYSVNTWVFIYDLNANLIATYPSEEASIPGDILQFQERREGGFYVTYKSRYDSYIKILEE